MKKQDSKYGTRCVRNDMFIALVCSESNLAFIPKDTQWVGSGVTTYINISMQGFLWSKLSSEAEIFIFGGDGNKVTVEAIRTFRLELKPGFYLDLIETFVAPYFSHLYMLEVVSSYIKIPQISSRDTN